MLEIPRVNQNPWQTLKNVSWRSRVLSIWGILYRQKGVAANLAKVEAIWIPRVDRVLLEVHDQLRIHSIAIYTVT